MYAEDAALGGGAAIANFQPLFGDGPGTGGLGASAGANAALNNAVDSILNVSSDTAANGNATAMRLSFEFETPRPSRIDQGFYKRVWGELRSSGGYHELSIHVGDIDRSWLTTDACAALDVAFQAGFPAGASRVFPVSSVPISARDGTADVRVPAFAGQAGVPTEIRVTSVAARACGAAPPPPPVDCTNSFEAREALLQRSKQILLQRDAIYDGLSVLQDALSSAAADQAVTESTLTQGLLFLSGAGAVAEAALTLGGVTSPAIEAIRAGEDLGNYLLRLKALVESGAPPSDPMATLNDTRKQIQTLMNLLQKAADADLEKGATTMDYLLRGPRPQTLKFDLTVLSRLKAVWMTLDNAAERGRAYQAARSTLGSVTTRLESQLAAYHEDLADSKKGLELIQARLAELTTACSVTSPNR